MNKPFRNRKHLRLYGHNFCPFVARARYTLSAAKIKFQEVVVNMEDKSPWLIDVSKGLLPVLEFPDKEFLTTSKMILNWVVKKARVELVPEDNEKFLKFSEVMNDLNDLVQPIYGLYISRTESEKEITKFIIEELPKHEKLAAEAKPFLLGSDKLTIIDL